MTEMETTETNWNVASSSVSVANCVTFESSLSLLNDDNQQQASSSPLFLRSPSPDSSPCEIKICFNTKHELRQVYVRSTARVYEIYTASDLQSSNEYLCTVRCGVASRDGEILRAPNVPHVDGSHRESSEENIKNEDDWVEVKIPECTNSTEISQDLFEATAELNDVSPCISVTLRLLSLQSKGCVYVDEIYIFGDPDDSTDSESQESRNGNSSSGSLMAMFLPTIMQLSKTSGLGHLNAVKKEKQSFSADDLEETQPLDSVTKTQLKGKASIVGPQEVKLKEVNGGWVAPSLPCTSSQVSKLDSDCTAVPSQADTVDSTNCLAPSEVAPAKSNHGCSLGGNIERAFEQLVSRIDRIEQICLGFQEKMALPMSSIEARLQKVEQQLDTLTKKLQNPGSSSCGRCAPEGSFIESDAIDYAFTRENEPEKRELVTEVHISDSANTSQMLPGLIVTAPEFPDGEDEEDNASGQKMGSSCVEVKRSIDDALSSALANFLSTGSSKSPKYTKSLTVKAPDFSSEDEDDRESNNETANNESAHPVDCEKINHIQVLTSSNISLESGAQVDEDSKNEHTEECGQSCSMAGDQEVSVTTSSVADHNPKIGLTNNFEDGQSRELSVYKTDDLFNSGNETSNELLGNQTASGLTSVAQEGSFATVATEVGKKPSHEDIIENVLGFSIASSAVDFETSLLDVKFISQRSPVTDPLLEALLVDTPETNSQDSSGKETGDHLAHKEQEKTDGILSLEEHSNLVSVDDEEAVNPTGTSDAAVEKDYSPLMTGPVNREDDNVPGDHKRKLDEISASSLI
ncbi:hypothetical protein HN51_010807 [Arachis hypogaea]|uniref:Uncharacterized protein n=1 Tax=Arachis hypogaea TaxID=3818 RepID=A0A445E1X6_ARAHY|nr:uncharacterized protein LOC112789436 [Arachis hypogaea]QHO55958.1 uncharacterized protein DS421_3g69550 [Arachis hypogaea]RYR69406.1 hypothetical protein Ahy_A03g015954 [Arachis hypogaea]